MGVILHSSAVVAGERGGPSAAEDAAQAQRRQKFFDDLFAAVPVYPRTFEIARRPARIDGESRRKGVSIPFQDLVIGVTALEFDYAVATLNAGHFRLIPGLTVVDL